MRKGDAARARANGTWKSKKGDAARARANGTWKSTKGKAIGKAIGKGIGKAAAARANGTWTSTKGRSAAKSAAIAERLLMNPLLANIYDADAHLYHATTHGDDILKSEIILTSMAQHGKQKGVWAADSLAGAINHMVKSPRHRKNIENLNYNIHIFVFKSGTYQRALFKKASRGGYSTSLGYKGAGGKDIQLYENDNNQVDHIIINVEEHFKK